MATQCKENNSLKTYLDTLGEPYTISDNIHETKIIFKIYNNNNSRIYPNDLVKYIKENNKKSKITVNFILKTKDGSYLYALRRSSFIYEILINKPTLKRIIKSKYYKKLLTPNEYYEFVNCMKRSILSPLYKEYENDKDTNHHDPSTRWVPIGGTQKNFDHLNCFTTLLRETVEELGRDNVFRDKQNKDGLTFNCRSDMYYLTITYDKTRTLEDENLWISITFRADININSEEIVHNFNEEFPNGKSFEIEELILVNDPSSIGYDAWND